MKYFVNKSCMGCGACEFVCPQIFRLDENRKAHAEAIDVPPELEKAANYAMESCPGCAIVPEDV